MSKDTLTITDNRTGKTFEIPIEYDTIRAIELRQIKVNDDDFGIKTQKGRVHPPFSFLFYQANSEFYDARPRSWTVLL